MLYDESKILNLISHIHSQSQTFLQKELKSLDLKELATSHANILFCLSQNNALSQGQLSEKINRDKSTTTALVKKLQKENLVQFLKDANDSRKKLITLTEQGKKYTIAMQNISKNLLEKSWNNFTEQERNSLTKLLNKLSDNL